MLEGTFIKKEEEAIREREGEREGGKEKFGQMSPVRTQWFRSKCSTRTYCVCVCTDSHTHTCSSSRVFCGGGGVSGGSVKRERKKFLVSARSGILDDVIA